MPLTETVIPFFIASVLLALAIPACPQPKACVNAWIRQGQPA